VHHQIRKSINILGTTSLTVVSPVIGKPMQMVIIQIKTRVAGHSFYAGTFCFM
jgi:hypothetical protein